MTTPGCAGTQTWSARLIAPGWQARSLRGTAGRRWAGQRRCRTRLNAYRVLLTRARFATVIWVPQGAARDATRDPARYDAVADYLLECGIIPLDDASAAVEDAAMTEPTLL